MSRTQARRSFTLKDHAGAYKDIDAVMAAQRDLDETVATLKQVLCVKG
jgi:tRNA-splicing ligase RtcB